MKRIVIVLSTFLYSITAFTQSTTGSDIKAGWGTLDYAVPESPALKIMGGSADNILKPTSVRKLALNVGNYLLNSSSVIPKSMAVEISPLLLNEKASLNDYNSNKFMYRMRVSFGTGVTNNGAYTMAEGLRFTLIDKTDLRDFTANPGFTNFLYAAAINKSTAIDNAIIQYIQTHPTEQLIPITAREKYATDSVFKSTIDDLSKQYYDKTINIDAVAKYRDSVKNLLWNAPIWELGVAALQSSPDSLVKNLKFSQIGLWSTAGFPIAKKGQILIGTKLSFVDSVQWQTNFSIGERLYYGSNNFKGFLQAQYDYRNNINYFTTSLGCQFNIANGFWGDFTLNLVVDGNGKLSYQPGFNVSFGSPEKKKL